MHYPNNFELNIFIKLQHKDIYTPIIYIYKEKEIDTVEYLKKRGLDVRQEGEWWGFLRVNT